MIIGERLDDETFWLKKSPDWADLNRRPPVDLAPVPAHADDGILDAANQTLGDSNSDQGGCE